MKMNTIGSTLISTLYISTLLVTTPYAQDVNVSLDFTKTHPISPMIYGYNQDHVAVDSDMNLGSRRLGGNRMTAHNWERNVDNAYNPGVGSYLSNSRISDVAGVAFVDKNIPGEAIRKFHQDNLDNGLQSIITVPIQGWVAADKLGAVTSSPPSDRWDELVYSKGSAFVYPPDINDGKVYLDEEIYFLTQQFGKANTANGVKYLSLDNEPSLWNSTHGLIQPTPLNVADYTEKVIAAAKAIKAVDPDVKLIFGEYFGGGIYDLRLAPDWTSQKASYDWYIDYVLDKLKKASDEVGYNLVDIISFHFYPMDKIGATGEYNQWGTLSRDSKLTSDYIRSSRMSFSRSLWDATYLEPSWLTIAKLKNQPHNLLGRVQNSIDTYFPGIKIMIGEIDYGNDLDISHGIGMADFLGTIAEHGVEIATWWDLNISNASTFTESAYKLFRNYDGSKGTYGDIAITTTFDSPEDASVWGSIDSDDNDLHLIILNKDNKASQDFSIDLSEIGVTYTMKDIYGFDVSNSAIHTYPFNGTLTSENLNITVPKLTAFHVIIRRDGVVTSINSNPKITQANLTQINGLLKVNLPVNVQNGQATIYSINGEVLKSLNLSETNNFTIDISDLTQSSYMIQITGENLDIKNTFTPLN